MDKEKLKNFYDEARAIFEKATTEEKENIKNDLPKILNSIYEKQIKSAGGFSGSGVLSALAIRYLKNLYLFSEKTNFNGEQRNFSLNLDLDPPTVLYSEQDYIDMINKGCEADNVLSELVEMYDGVYISDLGKKVLSSKSEKKSLSVDIVNAKDNIKFQVILDYCELIDSALFGFYSLRFYFSYSGVENSEAVEIAKQADSKEVQKSLDYFNMPRGLVNQMLRNFPGSDLSNVIEYPINDEHKRSTWLEALSCHGLASVGSIEYYFLSSCLKAYKKGLYSMDIEQEYITFEFTNLSGLARLMYDVETPKKTQINYAKNVIILLRNKDFLLRTKKGSALIQKMITSVEFDFQGQKVLNVKMPALLFSNTNTDYIPVKRSVNFQSQRSNLLKIYIDSYLANSYKSDVVQSRIIKRKVETICQAINITQQDKNFKRSIEKAFTDQIKAGVLINYEFLDKEMLKIEISIDHATSYNQTKKELKKTKNKHLKN